MIPVEIGRLKEPLLSEEKMNGKDVLNVVYSCG
jgi:hypothetical protein